MNTPQKFNFSEKLNFYHQSAIRNPQFAIPTMTPSFDLQSLSQAAGAGLLARSLSVAPAESCTGGLLASTLTDVAGSSAYVVGGVVSYSNEAKMQLLGVQEQTLIKHGAVSAETAGEMARGVRRLLDSDLGIAVTGIAGPDGGTEEKPVGLVYLHLSAAGAEWGERHVWEYDRAGNKAASVAAALHMLLRYLEQPPVASRRPIAEVIDRPVVVEATCEGGEWRPRAVWIGPNRMQINGWGRQTRHEDGSTTVLVEAVDTTRLELVVDVGRGQWRLRRAWWGGRSA